jgi:multicomponent Na+:H+ antiporter subunit F
MTLQDLIGWVVLPLLWVASGLSFVRLLRGPSLPDRVVALDLMSTTGIAICAVYALLTGWNAFLDVALVVGLIGFLGTVAFAHYIERTA